MEWGTGFTAALMMTLLPLLVKSPDEWKPPCVEVAPGFAASEVTRETRHRQ